MQKCYINKISLPILEERHQFVYRLPIKYCNATIFHHTAVSCRFCVQVQLLIEDVRQCKSFGKLSVFYIKTQKQVIYVSSIYRYHKRVDNFDIDHPKECFMCLIQAKH